MMTTKFLLGYFLFLSAFASAQTRFPRYQVSINAFRNPSIGVEFHQRQVSVHAGYYITNFTSGNTTGFLKTGITYWFLPFGKNDIPSSLYIGTSYLHGLTREYKGVDAVAAEFGARVMVWQGIQFRLGVIGIAAKDRSFKINPTPGISYSFKF